MNSIKQNFIIGDIVCLKSGGPKMTISQLEMNISHDTLNFDDFTGYVKCKWFTDNGESKLDLFHQDMLEKIE